jgi:hypothetical protein
MQIRQPPENTVNGGPRVAEVCAGVRIEYTCDSPLATLQYNNVRLLWRFWLSHAQNFVGWVGSPHTLFQIVYAHPRAARVGDDYYPAQNLPIKLPAENERAAGNADHHDIKANPDTHPQVNLEKGFANPQALRALNPLSPECQQEIIARIGTACAGLEDGPVSARPENTLCGMRRSSPRGFELSA